MVNKFHYMVMSHLKHYNKCNLNNTLEIEHNGNKFSFELLTFDSNFALNFECSFEIESLNVPLNYKVWTWNWKVKSIKFNFEIEHYLNF